MSLMHTMHKVVWVPVHPAGRAFVIAMVLATLVVWVVLGFYLAQIPFILLLLTVYFFRDPTRTVPHTDGAVLSSADGVVSGIQQTHLPAELGGDDTVYHKVSVFLSVFDVHVNRNPVTGTVCQSVYVPGKFINADMDKASEDNERSMVKVETDSGEHIVFVQIAGLIARRIVSQLSVGQRISQGERYGIIRFGSRCDIYFPLKYKLMVDIGSVVVGGESILAVDTEVFSPDNISWNRV